MYDFLYSDVWWMETIVQTAIISLVTAVIAALATFVSAWLSYNHRISKGLSSLRGEHTGLSKEHVELREGLSKEHVELRMGLSKEHVELREALGQKIQSASDGIKGYLEEEKRKEELKLIQLNQNKLLEKIQQGSMASEAMWKEYLEMQTELKLLQEDYEAALARIEQLESFINIANQAHNEEWELEL